MKMRPLDVCAVLLFLFIGHGIANGQNVPTYKKAIRYLSKQYPGQEVVVSETLLSADLASFYYDISRYWKKSERETLRILDSLDMTPVDSVKSRQFFYHQTVPGHKPGKIVYFSRVINNMLVVDVFDHVRGDDYGMNASLNKCDQYLFVLKNNKTISKIFKAVMQYE